MNPDFRKVALVAAALGLLVSLFVALRPSDEDETAPATTTIATTTAEETVPAPPASPTLSIRIQGGAPAGGIQRATVKRASEVSIRVVSDTAGTLHVHGYDLTSPIEATGTQEVEFAADRAGVFEIELEGTHTLLAELTVDP